MNLEAQLKAALDRVAQLKAISDRDYTEEEIKEADTLATTISDLREKIARNQKAKDAIKGIADSTPEDDEDPEDDDEEEDDPATGTKQRQRRSPTKTRPRSFGDAFINSEEFKAFTKQYPSGVGSGSPVNIGRVKLGSADDWFMHRKATGDTLISDIAHIQPIRMPTIDQVDRNRLTFLDLISRGRTGGNFEYVQVVGVTRNAEIVPEAQSRDDDAALKPLSDIQTDLADAKVFTYADGYDVTNQLLSDAPAFASYMNNELEYSLDNVVEEYLLNGTGTNGKPKGILNTSGVQEKTYTGGIDEAGAKAFIKATRYAIRDLLRLPGGTVDAVVMSPEMDAEIDLLQDANERYYGQGPFGTGPGTLWGRPRVVSERLVDTTAILGDFKQVALLDREGLSVLAFNQHKDYAQRNMTYVRAELRAAQVIWKPNRLSVITAGTGA
jgi:HK97 family phage major capsid protein